MQQTPQQYLDGLIAISETEKVPHVPGDVYDPVHADGTSDLNQHTLDMLAEPDVSQDPYRTAGSTS